MRERVDHIQRLPLPWRAQTITECGLPIEAHPVISRADLKKRVADLGQQRAAYTTCMTCWDRMRRYPWNEQDETLGALIDYLSLGRWGGRDEGATNLIRSEVEALTALIAAHRDEWDEFIAGKAATVDLASARKARAARRRVPTRGNGRSL